MPDQSDNTMNKLPANEHAPEGEKHAPDRYKRVSGALAAGLVLALAGVGYLWMRSNDLATQIANAQDSTKQQVSKLSEATTALLEQRLASVNEELGSAIKESAATVNSALKQTRTQMSHQGDEFRGKLEQQQQQLTGELTDLKTATASADSKIQDVTTDVSAVKTDVNGVRAGVASTKEDLDKTTADLKRVIGDMGTMSGLIATNAKDLEALRALGERNYIEFDLSKRQPMQKIGDVTVTLKNSDPKRNRYTVEILADDKSVSKRDKTVNEPVQFYLSKSKQPYEIVVNQVKKDEVVGYISEPKVLVARQ